ncbi:NAD(P)/FAD-dependent oxidoreductase [Gordonia sp. NPDC003376]
MNRVVVVGGGVASAATAAGLREAGFDGSIGIVSDEPHAPYERPPLSKQVLAGTFTRDDCRIGPEQWYADNDIDLILGTRATELDLGRRRVTLSGGGFLDYDALVLATGVRARTIPAFTGERVHTLRSIADSERLAERLIPGRRLAVLGAGFIGCEVAAAATGRGVQVTVFDPNPTPLARAAGTHIGRAMTEIHTDHGVDMRAGEVIVEIAETATGLELRTSRGQVTECDDLVVGIGSVANSGLAVAAGLEVRGGIVTDEFGRTAAPGVYAIGDVAERPYPGHGGCVRVEHHDTARRHGANVAVTLLGGTVSYDQPHWFWSDQYDHSLQAVGRFDSTATQVIRGSVEDRSFAVVTVTGRQITGIVALNRPRDVMQARKVMATAHEVSVDQLADDGFQLKSLLPQRAGTRRREVRI